MKNSNKFRFLAKRPQLLELNKPKISTLSRKKKWWNQRKFCQKKKNSEIIKERFFIYFFVKNFYQNWPIGFRRNVQSFVFSKMPEGRPLQCTDIMELCSQVYYLSSSWSVPKLFWKKSFTMLAHWSGLHSGIFLGIDMRFSTKRSFSKLPGRIFTKKKISFVWTDPNLKLLFPHHRW